MPRWLYLTVCVVLYAIVMAVIGALLNAYVPGGLRWLDSKIGDNGTTALIVIVIGGCLIGGLISLKAERRQRQ